MTATVTMTMTVERDQEGVIGSTSSRKQPSALAMHFVILFNQKKIHS